MPSSGEDRKIATGVAKIESLEPADAAAPSWDDFRIFRTVAREGSFGKAALKLGVQKSTVSRRIGALETNLGLKLLDRDSRGIVLTPEGKRIANDAAAMETIITQSAARVRESAADMEGECRLLMSEGLAVGWLIPYFLAKFERSFPRLVLRLGVAYDEEHWETAPFDLQIRYAPRTDGDTKTVRLGTFHFTYLASRDYLERHGAPATQGDLSKHRLADVTPSLHASAGILSTYSSAAGMGRAAVITNSGHIVAAAVRAGSVIGLLPSYAYLIDDRLEAVMPGQHFETGVYLNFRESAGSRPRVRAMIEFLRNEVFNRRRMPWFADEYVPPVPEWRDQFSALLKRDALEARRASAAE